MQYHVYILYSKKIDRFYIGQCSDLGNRVVEHNTGESSYTSQGTPWTLLCSTLKPNFRASELLEQKLKNLSRDRKIKFMRKYTGGVVDPELLQELIAKYDLNS